MTQQVRDVVWRICWIFREASCTCCGSVKMKAHILETILEIFHLHLHAMSPYMCPLFNAIFLFSDPSFLITVSNLTFKKYLFVNIPAYFCR